MWGCWASMLKTFPKRGSDGGPGGKFGGSFSFRKHNTRRRKKVRTSSPLRSSSRNRLCSHIMEQRWGDTDEDLLSHHHVSLREGLALCWLTAQTQIMCAVLDSEWPFHDPNVTKQENVKVFTFVSKFFLIITQFWRFFLFFSFWLFLKISTFSLKFTFYLIILTFYLNYLI